VGSIVENTNYLSRNCQYSGPPPTSQSFQSTSKLKELKEKTCTSHLTQENRVLTRSLDSSQILESSDSFSVKKEIESSRMTKRAKEPNFIYRRSNSLSRFSSSNVMIEAQEMKEEKRNLSEIIPRFSPLSDSKRILKDSSSFPIKSTTQSTSPLDTEQNSSTNEPQTIANLPRWSFSSHSMRQNEEKNDRFSITPQRRRHGQTESEKEVLIFLIY
jgi:hypothetical protein